MFKRMYALSDFYQGQVHKHCHYLEAGTTCANHNLPPPHRTMWSKNNNSNNNKTRPPPPPQRERERGGRRDRERERDERERGREG